MLVMGLVLSQSLMAISTTGMLLYAKVFLLYIVLWECIVVVYKYFDRSLHVKLKNKNDNGNNDKKKKKKKNWRNRLFVISPMFVVQFSPYFRCTYILTSAINLRCQK